MDALVKLLFSIAVFPSIPSGSYIPGMDVVARYYYYRKTQKPPMK